MESIKLDISKATQVLNPGTVEAYAPQVAAAQEALEKGTCLGNDFLGWLHLPTSITDSYNRNKQCSQLHCVQSATML